MDNLIHLADFETSTITENLKTRYKQDKIYTNIGLILVAVNPFKQLGIYTADVMARYSQGDPLVDETCPPHVFRTAALCYRGLREDRANQSVVISGESGAGKSETTKLILEYLTHVAGSKIRGKCNLMDSNHLLEALGNAKTIRNNNSSRFGKWMQVFFDKRDVAIVGTTIVNFLLEKTRVVHQASGERSYHIFYQFCDGASASVKRDFLLLPVKNFAYLNKGGSPTISGVKDAEGWELTLTSLDKLSFSQQDILALQRVLAIVLHMGNLVIENNAKDQAEIRNKNSLDLVARLMQVDTEGLEQVLVNKAVKVYSDVMLSPVSATFATQTRDALAKGLYGSLFDWVVKTIQTALSPPTSEKFAGAIGVLDIFGFEHFTSNSLEQLFINYANEKLQQLFNQCVFKMEQAEYAEEGLKLSAVSFSDNIQCCNLIDSKGGILRMIEEEGVVPSGSDPGLLTKMIQTFNGKHPNFDTIKTNKDVFIIYHYAGEVVYEISGFVEKNKDKVGKEVINFAATSEDSLIPLLVKSMDSNPTLSKGFQASLFQLNSILEATQLHFVRCIKPNSDKKPNTFLDAPVIEQIRNAGLSQAVEIRKAGYSNRKSHKDFAFMYRCLGPRQAKGANPKAQCEAIKKHLTGQHASAGFADIQIGKTKVFWRSPQEVVLCKLRAQALHGYVLVIQRFRFVVRARVAVRVRREVVKKCEAVLRTKDQKFAQDTLKLAELHGIQHPMVTKVRELLNLQKEVAQQIAKLQQAIKGPLDKLPAAVSEARQFNFACPNKDLQALLKTAETKIQAEEKAREKAAATAAAAAAPSSPVSAPRSAEGKAPPPPSVRSPTIVPRIHSRPSQAAKVVEAKETKGGAEILDTPVKRGLNLTRASQIPKLETKIPDGHRNFPLHSFEHLRTRTAYTKGWHMNKEEQASRMLIWQDFPIVRSMTLPDPFEKDHVHPLKRVKSRRVCVEMHKNILGFMGDIRAVYPNPLGFHVLQSAFYNPLLRDECFCQLIKQTSCNPTCSVTSGRRHVRGCICGLKLIFFCLTYFTPSPNSTLTSILTEHLGTFQPTQKPVSELKFDNEKDVAALCLATMGSMRLAVLPKLEDFSALVTFQGTCDKLQDMLKIYSDWNAKGGEGSCPEAMPETKEREEEPSRGLFGTLTGPLRGRGRERVLREDPARASSPVGDPMRASSPVGREPARAMSPARAVSPPARGSSSSYNSRPERDSDRVSYERVSDLSEAKSKGVRKPSAEPPKPTRENTATGGKCACGEPYQAQQTFCCECGEKVPPDPPPRGRRATLDAPRVPTCAKCGNEVPAGNHKFCLHCGTAFRKSSGLGVVDLRAKRAEEERVRMEKEQRIREEKESAQRALREKQQREEQERADREREAREKVERAKREQEEREEKMRRERAAKEREEREEKARQQELERQRVQAATRSASPTRARPPPGPTRPSPEAAVRSTPAKLPPTPRMTSAPQTPQTRASVGKACRACGVVMEAGEKFCTGCGTPDSAPPPSSPSASGGLKACGACGAENQPKFKFCLGCGGKF